MRSILRDRFVGTRVFALLAILTCIASANSGSDDNNRFNTNYMATFRIHYPESMLCSSCILNFATNISDAVWAAYLPDSNFRTTYNVTRVSQNTFVATQQFSRTDVGKTFIATVYYNAWNAKGDSTQTTWLNEKCRNVLNNFAGTNKGQQIHFTLPRDDVSYDLYPYFCTDRGEVRNATIPSPQFSDAVNTKIYYYVPPSVLENPIPRKLNYLVQLDGFAIEKSFSLQYDSVIANSLVPEFVAFGLGFGTDQDPWAYGDSPRRYRLTPDKCAEPFPLGNCSSWNWGGGYATGDFLHGSALPYIIDDLDMMNVDRDNLMISGHSLGGLLSCVLAYTNSSRWSGAYCGSGAFWVNKFKFEDTIKQARPQMPIKIFLDYGGRENALMLNDGTKRVYEALLARPTFELGENLMLAGYAGDANSHQFNSWSERTPLALAFLYNEPKKIAKFSEKGTKYEVLSYGDHHRSFTTKAVFTIPTGSDRDQKGGALEGSYDN